MAFDPDGGLRPFQELGQRRRRHGIERAVRECPIALFAFDLLYADGKDPTRLPYSRRRERLEEVIAPSGSLQLSVCGRLSNAEELDAFFEQAVTEGCEGLVCKSLAADAVYQAGARGWLWIKLKRECRTELRDTFDLVVVGAFHGRGKRAGAYGALLLAAYDETDDTFRSFCRCGTGFNDADLAAVPGRLEPYRRSGKPPRVDSRIEPDVWFDPGLVLEVFGAEITVSPNHTTAWGIVKDGVGLALRFPRFTGRYRDDKGPVDATTAREILELFDRIRRSPAKR